MPLIGNAATLAPESETILLPASVALLPATTTVISLFAVVPSNEMWQVLYAGGQLALDNTNDLDLLASVAFIQPRVGATSQRAIAGLNTFVIPDPAASPTGTGYFSPQVAWSDIGPGQIPGVDIQVTNTNGTFTRNVTAGNLSFMIRRVRLVTDPSVALIQPERAQMEQLNARLLAGRG